MVIQRKLRKGDKVRCKGYEFEISKIIHQDCYRDKWDNSRSYIDIAFEDPNGGYHSWKSHIDGGKAIINDTLRRFMDTTTGWYRIPFNDMVGDVTEEVLERIAYSGMLIANDNEGYKTYILVDVDKFNVVECEDIRRSDYMYSKVKEWMEACHCPVFHEVELECYYDSIVKQNAIDDVLLRSTEYKELGTLNTIGLKRVGDYLYLVKTNAWWGGK